MKLGFVIPVYNHGKTLESVVASLLPYKKTIIVVDDGNNADEKVLIQKCANLHSEVILVSCLKNGGKGKAMKAGVKKAFELGLTHVFQIDSDGQHDVESVASFIDESEKNPKALICGYPLYDESAPALRKNGRVVANNWAKIVTFDSSIKDSLCGFRIYPVAPYVKLFSAFIDSRMGYDVDILVRMIWKNVPVIYKTVKVSYPKDGISNFRLVRDNIHISLTFTRLCIGMIFRSPVLLFRKLLLSCQKKKQQKIAQEKLWYENKESVKSASPIKFTIKLVSFLPLWLIGLIVYPVS
ncbi:MAG: glycosyltransferase family 2 protein, partial [Treponema sp.]|nr:glycosyltransferase family 2 protein [Treponema sp.]